MGPKFFTPSRHVNQNVNRYASKSYNSNDSMILPCVITKVLPKQKVSIFIPNFSTIIDNLPFVSPVFSEFSGDIVAPEENSMALYIRSVDNRRFVMGGFSLSDTYTVRNIMEGESERYTPYASYKQDLCGNQLFSLSNGTRISMLSNGRIHEYGSGFYRSYPTHVEWCGILKFSDGSQTPYYVIKRYQFNKTTCSLSALKQAQKKLSERVLQYIVDTQNILNSTSKEEVREYEEKLKQYSNQDIVSYTIEEFGCHLDYDFFSAPYEETINVVHRKIG